jgi:DNA-binding MarR family transcriptional regulator
MHQTTGCSPPPEFSGADPTASAAWHAFMGTLHSYRRLMAHSFTVTEIPPGQIMALNLIGHDDGITQRDLAERMRISRPTLTVMLQKMEKASLVERTADGGDQRFTHLHLTAEGLAVHERMHGVMGGMVSDLMGPLSEDDRAELTRLLGLVHDNINTALETANSADKEAAE